MCYGKFWTGVSRGARFASGPIRPKGQPPHPRWPSTKFAEPRPCVLAGGALLLGRLLRAVRDEDRSSGTTTACVACDLGALPAISAGRTWMLEGRTGLRAGVYALNGVRRATGLYGAHSGTGTSLGASPASKEQRALPSHRHAPGWGHFRGHAGRQARCRQLCSACCGRLLGVLRAHQTRERGSSTATPKPSKTKDCAAFLV